MLIPCGNLYDNVSETSRRNSCVIYTDVDKHYDGRRNRGVYSPNNHHAMPLVSLPFPVPCPFLSALLPLLPQSVVSLSSILLHGSRSCKLPMQCGMGRSVSRHRFQRIMTRKTHLSVIIHHFGIHTFVYVPV